MRPCWATSLPNVVRGSARFTMYSRARSATPIDRMQWWMRPGPRRAWADGEAAALLAEEVVGRHPHVVEDDLAVATAVLVAEHVRERRTVRPGASLGTTIIDC